MNASRRQRTPLAREDRGRGVLSPSPSTGEGRGGGASLTDRARALRRSMTDAERRLWLRLKERQVNNARFRRQAPIGPYIVDFVCFDVKLVVEADGGQHADALSYDSKRDTWLVAQGFRVLRFWNNDVLRNTDGVVERVSEVLKETASRALSPPPQPSPIKGEGEHSPTAQPTFEYGQGARSPPPRPAPVKGEGEGSP